MADRLASVPEETAIGFTARSPPRGVYRDWIRTVTVSGLQIRSTLFSSCRSGHSGSSYSSASNSCPSNNSICSSGSAAVATTELWEISSQMASDGYTARMVQAFNNASSPPFEYDGGPDHALENWFFELDVDWVLQLRDELGLRQQLHLQDMSSSCLQDLVDRWIRALMVIVFSIRELVILVPAAARFSEAIIARMLVFVDVIVHVPKLEKLHAVLDMYMCVSRASHSFTPVIIPPEAKSIFNKISGSLSREANRLSDAVSSTMEQVRALMGDNDSWAVDIPRGGGEIHRNTRLMVDCVVSMKEACAWTQSYATSHKTANLRGLIDDTVDYVKCLLFTKSELCLDPSLRYLFLLNNSYFVAQGSDPSVSLDLGLWSGDHWGFGLPPECEKYMDSYLEVSWGHVLSCLSEANPPRPFRCWINTSSLAKFQSAFDKTYHTQKFWKVPVPRLRSLLRETITKRVISCYRNYLEEHQVSGGSNSPEDLEEMLGQLFEG